MVKIENLEIKEIEKAILRKLAFKPMTIAQVTACMGMSYATNACILKVWEAKEWVIHSFKGREGIFSLNKAMFEDYNEDVVKGVILGEIS